MLAVPADAGRQKGSGTAYGISLIERPFDAPVMRHIKPAPRRVIKVRGFGAGSVGLQEAPIGVEGCDDSESIRRASVLRSTGLSPRKRLSERIQRVQGCQAGNDQYCRVEIFHRPVFLKSMFRRPRRQYSMESQRTNGCCKFSLGTRGGCDQADRAQ